MRVLHSSKSEKDLCVLFFAQKCICGDHGEFSGRPETLPSLMDHSCQGSRGAWQGHRMVDGTWLAMQMRPLGNIRAFVLPSSMSHGPWQAGSHSLCPVPTASRNFWEYFAGRGSLLPHLWGQCCCYEEMWSFWLREPRYRVSVKAGPL